MAANGKNDEEDVIEYWLESSICSWSKCRLQFGTQESVRNHIAKDHFTPNVLCKWSKCRCQNTFKSATEFLKHINSLPMFSKKAHAVQCRTEGCELLYENLFELKTHRAICHTSPTTPSTESNQNDRGSKREIKKLEKFSTLDYEVSPRRKRQGSKSKIVNSKKRKMPTDSAQRNHRDTDTSPDTITTATAKTNTTKGNRDSNSNSNSNSSNTTHHTNNSASARSKRDTAKIHMCDERDLPPPLVACTEPEFVNMKSYRKRDAVQTKLKKCFKCEKQFGKSEKSISCVRCVATYCKICSDITNSTHSRKSWQCRLCDELMLAHDKLNSNFKISDYCPTEFFFDIDGRDGLVRVNPTKPAHMKSDWTPGQHRDQWEHQA
eukprot:m.155839 g.155839  ORF g.155839 m.155839 type:complete len:378 (-) comp30955_c0_seq8:99-1232(-)